MPTHGPAQTTQRSLLCPLLAALTFLSGCATTTRIYVKSKETTNDGNTMYMAVRTVYPKAATLNEPYQQSAAKLFTDPPDPTIITTQPIFPGDSAAVTLDNIDKDVVVSFFFTSPGPNWRVPLHRPLPAEIYIDLGQHQVERVQVKKR